MPKTPSQWTPPAKSPSQWASQQKVADQWNDKTIPAGALRVYDDASTLYDSPTAMYDGNITLIQQPKTAQAWVAS